MSPAGTPPLPTSSPHSALSRAVSLSISPLLVSSFLPPRSLSRPSLSSSYPHLSNLLFHPPPLSSPPRSRLPHPWEAPPVGQRRLKSGFPSRGRQRLVGGSSAGAGAASKTERPRPELAGHRPHRPPARPPDGRSPAGLGSGPTPAPPRAPLPPLAARRAAVAAAAATAPSSGRGHPPPSRAPPPRPRDPGSPPAPAPAPCRRRAWRQRPS